MHGLHAIDDVPKNCILPVQLRHGAFCNIELAAGRIWIGPSRHGQDSRAVVPEPRIDFNIYVAGLTGLRINKAASAVAVWVATLDAPVLDAVKSQSIVETTLDKVQKVARGIRHAAYEHLHGNRTFGRLHDDDWVRVTLRCSRACAVKNCQKR